MTSYLFLVYFELGWRYGIGIEREGTIIYVSKNQRDAVLRELLISYKKNALMNESPYTQTFVSIHNVFSWDKFLL